MPRWGSSQPQAPSLLAFTYYRPCPCSSLLFHQPYPILACPILTHPTPTIVIPVSLLPGFPSLCSGWQRLPMHRMRHHPSCDEVVTALSLREGPAWMMAAAVKAGAATAAAAAAGHPPSCRPWVPTASALTARRCRPPRLLPQHSGTITSGIILIGFLRVRVCVHALLVPVERQTQAAATRRGSTLGRKQRSHLPHHALTCIPAPPVDGRHDMAGTVIRKGT